MKYKLLSVALMAVSSLASTAHAETLYKQVTDDKVDSAGYAKTKYPIVFAHGLSGFTRMGTENFGLDYWYQILPDLARNGATVFATQVSPFNSSEIRGEQLRKQVDEILAVTGAEKVNLIGHSHGAQSVRYVAGTMPKNVASATTVGGVNRGSPMADTALELYNTLGKVGLNTVLTTVANVASRAIVWANGLDPDTFPHDSLAAAKSLSTEGALAFNKDFPAGIPDTKCGDGVSEENGIKFYSLTGQSVMTNLLDPIDYVFQATSLFVNSAGKNDGLVPVCSTRFGKTIRDDYKWNHLDEVNQMMGIRGWFTADPVQIYREHANRLKNVGL
ncbi:esterase/lipase family protein [Acinetobacter sp. WZC-1]|uniref:esterase/lipase family protein n=1 Tax=Acinetobacter sp. WZC-1 TaxID=3459034 RepID=UPI00403E1074